MSRNINIVEQGRDEKNVNSDPGGQASDINITKIDHLKGSCKDEDEKDLDACLSSKANNSVKRLRQKTNTISEVELQQFTAELWQRAKQM